MHVIAMPGLKLLRQRIEPLLIARGDDEIKIGSHDLGQIKADPAGSAGNQGNWSFIFRVQCSRISGQGHGDSFQSRESLYLKDKLLED
jgi:hypothetical protein